MPVSELHIECCATGALSAPDRYALLALCDAAYEEDRPATCVTSVWAATGMQPSPDDESVMIRRLPRTPSPLDLDAPLSIGWRAGDVW